MSIEELEVKIRAELDARAKSEGSKLRFVGTVFHHERQICFEPCLFLVDPAVESVRVMRVTKKCEAWVQEVIETSGLTNYYRTTDGEELGYWGHFASNTTPKP